MTPAYVAISLTGAILVLLIIGGVAWYGLTRKPDPLEDQDYRDDL